MPAMPALAHRPLLLRAAAVGIVVGLLAAALLRPALPRAVLIGWCVSVLVWVALITRHMFRLSVDDMRARAADLDDGKWAMLAATLGATLASLLAVVWTVMAAPSPNAGGAAALGIGTVVLSWLFVHVLFATHYAHAHWLDGNGIDFPGCDEPDFWEFLYFAFTVGMTFQVSDATTGTAAMRRLVLVHATVAFLFNAVILAVAVNLTASLVR